MLPFICLFVAFADGVRGGGAPGTFYSLLMAVCDVGFLAEVVCLLNQWIHGSSILFPGDLIPPLAGPEEGEEPGEGSVLRLIQIRLMRILFLQKAVPMCLVRRRLIFTCDFALHDSPRRVAARGNCAFKFQKRSQLFDPAHVSVAIMRSNSPRTGVLPVAVP